MNGWLVNRPLRYNSISKANAGEYPPGRVNLQNSIPKIPVNISTIVTPYEIVVESSSENIVSIHHEFLFTHIVKS